MRARATTIPDTHVLKILAQEYRQILVEALDGIKHLLSLLQIFSLRRQLVLRD